MSFLFLNLLILVAAQWTFASSSTTAKLYQSLEPAVGLGSNGLNILLMNSRGDSFQYYTTNSNYYFFSLGFDRFSFQAKFPSRDAEEIRKIKGDSKVTDYQMAFEITPRLLFDAFYQKYEGYYTEAIERTYILPEFSTSHLGGQFTYIFNSNYSLGILQSAVWKQKTTAGSPFLSFGVHEFELNGDLVPQKLNRGFRQNLENVKALSFSAKIGYGYTWIWKNWFAGAGAAYGGTANQIKYAYKESQDQKTTDSELGLNIGLAGGYQWTTTKLGLFTRTYNWGMKFDDKEITSNSTLTGLYVSSFF